MRLQRVAAMIAAAVGVGLLVVGCGPTPGTEGGTSAKGDTGKGTSATQPAGGGDTKPKELGDKVKAATDDINKDLDPLKKAIASVREKVSADKKNADGDAKKLEVANELDRSADEAEALVKQADEKVNALKGAKDAAAVDANVKAAKDLIEKAKPKLKDYLPK